MTKDEILDLLQDIESGAIDQASDLPTTLRRCVSLGGLSGSEQLTRWATRELKGYGANDDLPEYRTVGPFPVQFDGFSGNNIIRGQTLSLLMIPNEAQESLGKPVDFVESIAVIADIVAGARASGDDFVRIAPRGAEQLTAIINIRLAENEKKQFGSIDGFGPIQFLERVYWTASTSALVGILDNVRTLMVELVAQIRLDLRDSDSRAGEEVVSKAAAVVIGGYKPQVFVNQSGDNTTIVAPIGGAVASNSAPADSSARRLTYWVFGFIGAFSGIVTLLFDFHHH